MDLARSGLFHCGFVMALSRIRTPSSAFRKQSIPFIKLIESRNTSVICNRPANRTVALTRRIPARLFSSFIRLSSARG
ncbi:hypothetical protein LFL96_28505 [Paraburkholderia sp. D15]|uniref:hypothetical protein n=1 Tax=Paraburkholderia sp. D15 TaxID=2880218 RepID=UPI002478E970|nr:hypothetical protein [Paraburkholderia sp. D15]WGS52145.1 hypothetical protein LFL96_28505 [Paraburkholderia sp. D15]